MLSRNDSEPGDQARPAPTPLDRRLHLRRWLGFAVSGLVLFGGGCLFGAGWQGLAAQSPADKPVAMIGNEALYEKDYVPPPQAQVHKIRMQEYELKRRALEGAINKRLLQAEAAKLGMNEDDLLRQEADSRATEPDEPEVEQVWAQQLFQGGGQISQSKDELRTLLKQDRIAQARDEFFHNLRERAGVKIYLSPPRLDVSYDALRVRGNPEARITLVEFSDFHCPFCGQAYLTVKSLLRKYDGKIKVAYRDLPLLELQEPGVASAAEAARCAGDQGRFWPYHDLLFESQNAYGPAGFQEFATSLNLNLEQFGQCLESGKFKAKVHEDLQEAIQLGAVGTPYFFINGVPVSGARPQADFEAVIDAELALDAQ